MEITARIINPPKPKYGGTVSLGAHVIAGGTDLANAPNGLGSKQATIRPKDGAWNLVDKKFTKPMSLGFWIVVIFVPPNQFSPEDAKRTITDLAQACEAFGMQVSRKQPLIVYKNPQDNVDQSITEALRQTTNEPTQTFLVCILPDENNKDLYVSVKHCCNTKSAVANQCLRVSKCKDARPQYWANVALKINAKLGGVNIILDPKSAPIISDIRQPAFNRARRILSLTLACVQRAFNYVWMCLRSN
ncbi:hypothetical protein IW262DRAFT_543570 [Armillaria fumosa]|nr:hypothetical protein IW262DRAFT_543570 [Armillaria fumosa]